MPIKTIDIASSFLVQACANCGLQHTIRFDRGAVETKPQPFALSAGATLELSVDGKPLPTLTLVKADAKNLAATTADELKTKLASVTGVTVSVTAVSTVIIESSTAGASSSVQFTGGTGLLALGRDWDVADPCPARPMLGMANNGRASKDFIALRRCGCGTYDTVCRTWDVAPSTLAASFFYEHRKAVNSLSEYFKQQGWVHPAVAAEIAAETTPPPDRFPDGTMLINVPS